MTQGIRLATQVGTQRLLLPIIQQQATMQQAIATITTNLIVLDGAAAAALATHTGAANPHSQYATAAALTAGLAGKETIGAAAAAITGHTGAADPHPQYASDADLAALSTSFTAGIAGKETIGAAAAALAGHIGAANPHSQYATVAALTAGLAGKETTGAATAALATHTGANDPHPQYATDGDLAGLSANFAAGLAGKELIGAAAAALAGHTGAANPHSQYLKAADLGLSVPWASPGAIGETTPSTGKFTTLNITSIANNIGPSTGALICLGGAYIARNVYIDAQFTVADTLRHKGPTAGFFNAAPINRPTVNGSRGSGAALIQLLKALKDLGLITDSTTA